MNNFKIAIIFFIVTLGGYALALFLIPDVRLWVPSYIYHAVILLGPLSLIVFHRESRQTLGLIAGRWKTGLSAMVLVTGISFVIWWSLNRNLHLPAADHIFLAAVTWGALGEELLFRGYLQPKMENRAGRWPGLVVTSLLFGISHLPRIYLRQAAPVILVPEAFALGLAYGFIRDRTGSTYYGMICHMAYNAIVSVV